MRADLHIHSTFSDGIFPPEYIIDRVIEKKLDYFSITDHDTMGAYPRIKSYLSGLPADFVPTLIPGLEISTVMDARDVHMLGYYIEEMSPSLTEELIMSEEDRRTRTLAIVDKLVEGGYPISVEKLEKTGATINRTTIARLLVEAGAIPDVEYAYHNLIGKRCPYYVERNDMSTPRAIELIRASGGIPVMAHPALYHVEDLIVPCTDIGLGGIEAFHGDQTPDQASRLAALADKLGLLVTGGTDWHGDPLHAADIGQIDIPQHYLEEFLAADPR